MERGGCVHILTNKNKTTLYTGVTSDLQSRIYEHLNKKKINSLTAKYNLTNLVYYKFYPTIEEAIAEEKRIKAGNRKEKEFTQVRQDKSLHTRLLFFDLIVLANN